MTVKIRRDPFLKIGARVAFSKGAFVADSPAADGGDDTGPSPHDIYDAALGACKAMTIMWYARRQSIQVDDVQVTVNRDAGEERAGRYVLTSAITVRGDLTDAQLAELLAVAEKCPIHKLMTAVTHEIHTTLERENDHADSD